MKAIPALFWFFIIAIPAWAGDQSTGKSSASTAKPQVTTAIKLDQVGYPSSSPKLAMIATSTPVTSYVLRRADTNAIVFRGSFRSPIFDSDTGDQVQTADFSALNKTGTYYIEVPGIGRSWKFEIAPDVFARTYYLAMRGFYGQRCGAAVDMGPEFPAYKHPACHLNGTFHPSSGREGVRNNIGGWHDAGDYGRYTVNSGITNGTLLWAWELFPDKLKDRKLNLPESGNGTPDILNEVRWNIEWMLKMQDEDGGAWHKQTSVNFPGFISPDADNLHSEVIGTGSAPYKSTCATADLAAVAAIAARVFAPFDSAFAKRNLIAASKSWTWAEQHPNVTFKNPPGVSTGEYGDQQCGDERLWAAAELWRTTGDATYHQYFLANYAKFLPVLQSSATESWAQMAPMGLWTYALAGRNDQDRSAVEAIRKASADAARKIVRRTRDNPYQVSLAAKDYVWGSNGLAAQYGVQLLIANVLAPDPAFRHAAMDNLHYLLGRNAFSLSWVTQVGDNPYHHPHHRPSIATGAAEPWPGLLSGGPNSNRQDSVLKALPDMPPARMYADDPESYASNEIAINWQSPLVFLLAGELQ